MSKIKKIVVSGPRTSGKTSMLHLLDSKTNFVNYNHDKFLLLYNKLFIDKYRREYLNDLKRKKSVIINSRNLKKKIYLNIHLFKRKLYEIGYSWLESEAFYNESPGHFSLKSFHQSKKHNFRFDFENFEKEIKTKIFKSKKKSFSFEDLVDIYCFCYWNNNIIKKKKLINIVFKSPNEINTIGPMLSELKNSQFIYIKRDILGLVKSRAIDLSIRNNQYSFNQYFERVLYSKYVDNIKKNFDDINQLKKKFKTKLYITSLENIVYDTKNEMSKIIKFLNLKQNNQYFTPSYNGKLVESHHIEKINDDLVRVPNNLINLYNLRLYGLVFYTKNFSNFNLMNLLKYIYIKIKNIF